MRFGFNGREVPGHCCLGWSTATIFLPLFDLPFQIEIPSLFHVASTIGRLVGLSHRGFSTLCGGFGWRSECHLAPQTDLPWSPLGMAPITAFRRQKLAAYGSLMAQVPATLYNQRHPEASATVVIFPQCLGSLGSSWIKDSNWWFVDVCGMKS